MPGLSKEGYQEESTAAAQNASSAAQASSQGERAPARRQSPPYAGGVPYELPRPPRAGQPYNPLSIGRSDLDPIPLGPGGNPFAPPSLFGGAGEGDGMFVGRDHPMFRDRFRGPGTGPFAPGAVPPGARFDPIGPGMGPMGSGMFNPMGGRPPRVGGDPDNDELMPPGFENDPTFGQGNNRFGPRGGFGQGGMGGFVSLQPVFLWESKILTLIGRVEVEVCSAEDVAPIPGSKSQPPPSRIVSSHMV